MSNHFLWLEFLQFNFTYIPLYGGSFKMIENYSAVLMTMIVRGKAVSDSKSPITQRDITEST